MPTGQNLPPLNDILEPTTVGWWPLAPGWWLLIVLCLILAPLFGYGIWLLIQRKKRNIRIQSELDQVYQTYLKSKDSARFLQNVNILVKRRALSLGVTGAANAHGDEWRRLLERHLPSHCRQCLDLLATGPYEKRVIFDPRHLYTQSRHWLRNLKCSK